MTSTVPFVNDGAATNGNGSQLSATVSDAIRERLKQAGASFLANDNIAEHLQPGDLVRLEQEVAEFSTERRRERKDDPLARVEIDCKDTIFCANIRCLK